VAQAREFPVGLALLALVVGTQLWNSRFLATQGRTDLLLSISVIALMAVGETYVIVMRHVDLSVGSTLGLSAYVAGLAVRGHASAGIVTILAVGLGIGLAVGVVNGVLVALLRLPALVVTLGTLYVVQGVQALVAGPHRVNTDQLPHDVVNFGVRRVLGIPDLMWVAVVVALIGGYFLRTSRTGRDLYAMGSNPSAARVVGIPVARRTMTAFLVSGACAGLAGALYLAKYAGADANAGIGYELSVVAACVVGGVFIFGGSGSVLGAVLGAALLQTIAGSLTTLAVPEFWQQAVNGAMLLVAITIDRVLSSRVQRRVARVGSA
jgi:rhamnose transport system permease protein